MLTNIHLGNKVKSTSFPGSYAFFSFCDSANPKEIDYSASEVDIKQKTMFSFKLGLLKWLEKVANASLIWHIH